MSKNRVKVTKDTVPEGFTLSLAIVDAIPVVFFGACMVIISLIFSSKIFFVGALLALFAGVCKVLWKVIVVLKKKNIWFLFVQMRITMPIGFLLMLASLIINAKKISFGGIGRALISLPASIFYCIGIAGMILMSVFSVKLDNADVKANWIEQCTNGIAQIAFFVGLLLTYLS